MFEKHHYHGIKAVLIQIFKPEYRIIRSYIQV